VLETTDAFGRGIIIPLVKNEHHQITIEELLLVQLSQRFFKYVFSTNLSVPLKVMISDSVSRKKLGCGPGVYLLQTTLHAEVVLYLWHHWMQVRLSTV